jgi:hypothetical protein
MTRAPVKRMIRKGGTIACILLLPLANVLSLAQAPSGIAAGSNLQPEPLQQAPPQLLSPAQMENLVAPIALYPDPLLSEVLAASTYPLEVVEAGQWMQQNRNLQGQQLIEAAKQQSWDPSIQALVAFPDVMAQLNRDVQWTTDLGNAFLAQQVDVMDAVQRLRARAQNNGRLQSTPQQTVTTQAQDGQSAIAIQPADPQVIYPPVYNPAYVWGPPAYGAYPPLWYPPVDSGFGFGAASFIGSLFSGLLSWGGWGWGLSWLTHGLFLNGLFFNHFGFHGYGGYGGITAWAHSPVHRLGVPYSNHMVASRYNAGGYRGSSYNGSSGGARYGGGNLNARMDSARSEGAGGWRSFGESRSLNGAGSSYGSRSYEPNNRVAENRSGYGAGSQTYRGSAEGYRGGAEAYRGGSNFGAASRGYGAGPSTSYRAPAQGNHGFSGSGTAPSYRNSGLSRSFAPSYSAPRASSQHFSAPHGSASHSSSPHFSAPHSSGGHSGGGHSGGGHSGGGHSGGGGHKH